MIKNWSEHFTKDELNFKRRRNIKNVDQYDYNCGGYALETFNWYCPYDTDEQDDLYFGFLKDLDEDICASETAQLMVNHFQGDLRIIKSFDELQDNEYGIIYKTGGDDFHYVKRTKTGRFYHKPGKGKIRRMPAKEALSDVWETRFSCYSSKSIYLAKKVYKK